MRPTRLPLQLTLFLLGSLVPSILLAATEPGWTEFVPVTSDGSHGNSDQGSRIAYVDAQAGSNSTGAYYWWDGTQVVDANGNTYGNDPFNPTGSIRPFASITAGGGPSWRGQPNYNQPHYPDWILFKRNQNHSFNGFSQVGRSPEEPSLLGAYGDPSLPRPHLQGQITMCNCGDPKMTNMAVVSVQLGNPGSGAVSLNLEVPAPPHFNGDPEDSRSWLWFEDVLIDNTSYGISLLGVVDVMVYRSIIAHVYNSGGHNQGTFVSGDDVRLTVKESIYYQNGMKSDPVTDDTPARDIFSRNFYLGGGTRLGTHLINVISADGGSGGPQVRYGGIVEGCLVIEGYWFTSTDSSGGVPSWLEPGVETYQFRNNVQLVYRVPAPGQPSDSSIDIAAQPGDGFFISAASTGVFEDNIISGALLDELGFGDSIRDTSGIWLDISSDTNANGTSYSAGNLIEDNILYRVAGLYVRGTSAAWLNSGDQIFRNNLWYDRGSAYGLASDSSINAFNDLLKIDGNTFYAARSGTIQGGSATSWMDAEMTNNALRTRGQATWSDPNRTLKTYAEDILGLTVTSDSGMDEFFGAAIQMRKGQWNEAYTAGPIVDYIRGGFDLPPVSNEITGVAVAPETATIAPTATVQLSASVSPAGAEDTSVTWSSDNEAVATVDETGLVTGVTEGTATITATTNVGGLTDSAAITVENPPVIDTFAEAISATVVNAEDGDFSSAWFGDFTERAAWDGWILHSHLGWLWCGHVTTPELVWMWNLEFNAWAYTTESLYPHVFMQGTGWLYFLVDGDGELTVYRWNGSSWSLYQADA